MNKSELINNIIDYLLDESRSIADYSSLELDNLSLEDISNFKFSDETLSNIKSHLISLYNEYQSYKNRPRTEYDWLEENRAIWEPHYGKNAAIHKDKGIVALGDSLEEVAEQMKELRKNGFDDEILLLILH